MSIVHPIPEPDRESRRARLIRLARIDALAEVEIQLDAHAALSLPWFRAQLTLGPAGRREIAECMARVERHHERVSIRVGRAMARLVRLKALGDVERIEKASLAEHERIKARIREYLGGKPGAN